MRFKVLGVPIVACLALGACADTASTYMALAGPPPSWISNLTGGTGFFVDSRGDILTADHVVAGCPDLRVSGPNFMAVPARLLAHGPERDDLALIHADLHPLGVGRLAPAWRGLGQVPRIAGFPLRIYGYPKSDVSFTPIVKTAEWLRQFVQQGRTPDGILVYSGRLAARLPASAVDAGDAIWGVGVGIEDGFSGAPVFDSANHVIGIVTARFGDKLAFAHVSDAAIGFLHAKSIPASPAEAPPDPVTVLARIFCFRPGLG